MMKRTCLLLLLSGLMALPLLAQLPDETNGRVPELDAFHKPIYALWHKAWPAKDIAELKRLLTDVDQAYHVVAEAKLPGILRDKEEAWKSKLSVLTESMERYRTAVAANDSAGILSATEAVHMNYEMMVRLVRPVLKELDAFHQVLYVLHHYSMPNFEVDKIRLAADTLAVKMTALNGAVLPKRLEKKSEMFIKARKNLDEAVTKFGAAVKAGTGQKELAELEEQLHARYQVVEKVFD